MILYDCKGKKTKSGADVLFQVLYKKGEEAEDDDIVDLSFGRIIALAGDHFTNISDENRSPICGAFFKNETSKEERFESMVNNVKLDYDGYLRELNDLINKECDSVRKISEDPDQSVAEAYHKHDCGIPSNWSFYQASLNPTKFGILLSGYAWNSYINADHFVGFPSSLFIY